MKTANLVMAIIYTVIYAIFLIAALAMGEPLAVVLFLIMAAPVVMLWINFAKYGKK